MLLSTREEPFDSDEYIFEIKWDGFRCLAFINNTNLVLQSRNKKDLSNYFPELHNIRQSLLVKKAVLDGEICFLDSEGKPSFKELQGRIYKKNLRGEKAVTYIVWDILSYDNLLLYHKPLLDRKEYLTQLVQEGHGILLSDYIKSYGIKLFSEIKKNKLEGIVAKKIDSPYEFKRSKYWYKIKCWQYINVTIGGYSSDNSSLLVGKFDEYNLTYMGKVKIALDENMRQALFNYLPEIKISSCPFTSTPGFKKVYWVKPVIKTVIRYTELSKHNIFRHGYSTKIIID